MGGSEKVGRLVSACDGEACLDEDRVSSLRLLGSVGEPINPEAWIWYRNHIGGDHNLQRPPRDAGNTYPVQHALSTD